MTAYDFVVYGGLEGKVEQIGVDTVVDEEGNAYYEVAVRTTTVNFGEDKPIIPGMTVEVDILTGKEDGSGLPDEAGTAGPSKVALRTVRHIFISGAGVASARWRRAFPELTVFPSVQAYLSKVHNRGDFCWLDSAGFEDPALLKACQTLVKEGAPVVVLSATPAEAQAFAVLSVGVRGYCHAEAVPEQFAEVAAAVQAEATGYHRPWCSGGDDCGTGSGQRRCSRHGAPAVLRS